MLLNKKKNCSVFLATAVFAGSVWSGLPAHAASVTVSDAASLENALTTVQNGDTITLGGDITGSNASITLTTGETVTLDGGSNTLTGATGVNALDVTGAGTLILKNITLVGGDVSSGNGGNGLTADSNFTGLIAASGTVTTTGGTGGIGCASGNGGTGGAGVDNESSGTINVGTAVGGSGGIGGIGGIGFTGGTGGAGVNNKSNGTVNVGTATGGIGGFGGSDSDDGGNGGNGVDNKSSGTVNTGTTTGGNGGSGGNGSYDGSDSMGGDGGSGGSGVDNESSGAINVNTAAGGNGGSGGNGGNNAMGGYGGNGGNGVNSCSGGAVNVGTATYGCAGSGDSGTGEDGNSISGTANTGATVKTILLNVGNGNTCVLPSITIATSGSTNVGTLPAVYDASGKAGEWFTDPDHTVKASSPLSSSVTNLYSTFYMAAQSDPLTADSIMVTNNPGSDDTITINSLGAGDTVKVYDASTDGNIFGSASADNTGDTSSHKSVTLHLALTPGGGTIYVARTGTGKTESSRVPITYAAEFAGSSSGTVEKSISQKNSLPTASETDGNPGSNSSNARIQNPHTGSNA